MDGMNPMTILKAAAAGDLGAHRVMVDHLTEHAMESGDPVAMMEAVVFARLAATFGHEPDVQRFLFVLARATEMLADLEPLCIELKAEALAHASILADNGCDQTADSLAAMSPTFPREAMEMSHQFRERILTA